MKPLFFVVVVGMLCVVPAYADNDRARLAGISAASIANAEVIDMVVAVVDDDPILLSELQEYQAQFSAQSEKPVSDTTALRKLISEKLLIKEAEKMDLNVSEEEVTAYIGQIRAQNNLGDEEFAELLATRGLTIDSYTEQVRLEIIRSRVVSSRVRSRINVVDEDIERYFAERPDLRPESGQVRLIQITIDPTFSDDKLAALQKVIAETESATTIPGVVAEQDLGFVTIAHLRSEIANAVSKLAVGGVSDKVTTGNTAYLYKVYSKIDDNNATTDERQRKEIEEVVYQQQFAKIAEEYMTTELPREYDVEILLEK